MKLVRAVFLLPCVNAVGSFRHFKCSRVAGVFFVILLSLRVAPAEPLTVRYLEGSIHAFLVLRSTTNARKVLASGDLTQIVHGDRLVSRLVFRFKDGSVDDQTAVFTQRATFRLITDRHIQKGPMFPKPTDVLIDVSAGRVTVRYKDKGEEKIENSHLSLPPDLANGILLEAMKNMAPDTKETRLSYLAATPKPRIVMLAITPQGQETFSVAGTSHKAERFKVRVELGGMGGIIASLVNRQPADTNVWIADGEVPAFVKSEGPLYLNSPIWSIEMTSPAWH